MKKRRLFSLLLLCGILLGLCAGVSACEKEDESDPNAIYSTHMPTELEVWGLVEEADEEERTLSITVVKLTNEMGGARRPFSLFAEGDRITVKFANDAEPDKTPAAGQVVHLSGNYFEGSDTSVDELDIGYVKEVWDSLEEYNAAVSEPGAEG